MIFALHGGAGNYKQDLEKNCANALRKHIKNGEQEEILMRSIMELESDSDLNCGIGSNLTKLGRVECEASYMTSRGLAFGAVACVSNCIHPVFAARNLAKCNIEQSDNVNDGNFGLIKPMLLAGRGADEFCASLDVGIVENAQLLTAKTKREFTKAKQILDDNASATFILDTVRYDTVGGVAISPNGEAESCASSGGIILKQDGRVGHSAHFGGAIWSESRGNTTVSVSVSGCGEILVRTHFAENLAIKIFNWIDEDSDDKLMISSKVKDFLMTEVLASSRLANYPRHRLLFGGLLLIKTEMFFELISFHNTPDFAFAFSDQSSSIKRYKSKKEKIDFIDTRALEFCCTSFIL